MVTAHTQMFSDITLSDPDEMMKVTNQGKVAIDWQGFKRAYTLEPKKSVFVPFHVVCKYMGDPRSVKGTGSPNGVPFVTPSGEKGVVPDRRAELVRLSIFYGLYHNNIPKLPTVAPKVVVMTLTDRVLEFPITNPDGVSYGFDQTQTQNIDVRTELDRVKDQLAQLEQRQSALNSAMMADDPDAGEATEDAPPGL